MAPHKRVRSDAGHPQPPRALRGSHRPGELAPAPWLSCHVPVLWQLGWGSPLPRQGSLSNQVGTKVGQQEGMEPESSAARGATSSGCAGAAGSGGGGQACGPARPAPMLLPSLAVGPQGPGNQDEVT